MAKKYLAIVVIAIMMLGVFGLTACNNDTLDAYKTKGKAKIDAHVATKEQSDYTAENWEKLCNAAIAGKTAVDAAESKADVNTAVDAAKTEIEEVQKERAGMFYTLQEAYKEKLLTVEDLQVIATHYNNNTDPADALDDAMAKVIKETYRISVINMPNASLDGIIIRKYYGTYDGNIAVGITDEYNLYDYVVFEELTIADVFFFKIHEASIRIWNEK